MVPKLKDAIPSGVITGDNVVKLLEFCKKEGFALPAVNCTSSSTVNAALEAAKANNSPVFIQFSQGGSSFVAGKGLKTDKQRPDVVGAVAAALHVRQVAKYYDIPVILHTDHCPKKHIGWLEGMLEEDAKYFEKHGEPLFSSHMIDYSAEPDEVNFAKTKEILEKCAKINVFLEMEIGVTGGEEDGINNENVDNSKLYSTAEDVVKVYNILKTVKNGNFSVAAAFGNVHGVYKVEAKLRADLLKEYQKGVQQDIATKTGTALDKVDTKPVFLVFHGGSGSRPEIIKEAVGYGVVKMNIDTDLQWAYWKGVRDHEEKNRSRLQAQVGCVGKTLDEDSQPNKKLYDPRNWLRKAEQYMAERLNKAFADLLATNSLDLEYSSSRI